MEGHHDDQWVGALVLQGERDPGFFSLEEATAGPQLPSNTHKNITEMVKPGSLQWSAVAGGMTKGMI